MVTGSYKGLNRLMWLQGITSRGLRRATEGYRGLQGVTRDYKT